MRVYGCHGGSSSVEFRVWREMRARCLNPRDSRYPKYGGQGIGVCRRWTHFENFLTDMGRRPLGVRMALCRRDTAQDYSPENCFWGLMSEQNRRLNTKEGNDGKKNDGRMAPGQPGDASGG